MLNSKIVVTAEVKNALRELKISAHEIGSRNLSPHLRASMVHGGSGRQQSNSNFDVDDFMERQRILEEEGKQEKNDT